MESLERSATSPARVVIAVLITIMVTAAVAVCGLRYSHTYTASAYLLGTFNAPATGAVVHAASSPEGAVTGHDLTALARSMITDEAVNGIDRKYHPYTALATNLFPSWTASRLRSDLYIESIYSGSTVGAISVNFAGNDRGTALAIADAISEVLSPPRQVSGPAADSLERPSSSESLDPITGTDGPAAPPLQASSADPEAISSAAATTAPVSPAQPSSLAATSAEIAAEAKLDEQPAPPGESAQVAAAEALRVKRSNEWIAAWQKHQEIQAQIRSETQSLAAIEAEKQKIGQAVASTPRSLEAATAHARLASPATDTERAAVQMSIDAAESRLSSLRERYTENHPDVIEAREQVQILLQQLAQLNGRRAAETRPMPQASQDPLQSDNSQRVAALNEREGPIHADLKSLHQQLSANVSEIAELRRLAAIPPLPFIPTVAPEIKASATLGPASGPASDPASGPAQPGPTNATDPAAQDTRSNEPQSAGPAYQPSSTLPAVVTPPPAKAHLFTEDLPRSPAEREFAHSDSRFLLMKHAAIRSSEELFAPSALAFASIGAGLSTAFAFLVLVKPASVRRRLREEAHQPV
ncbi:MAG TPA: hypothetical protein VGD59_09640 [Acidisarcina sp.]